MFSHKSMGICVTLEGGDMILYLDIFEYKTETSFVRCGKDSKISSRDALALYCDETFRKEKSPGGSTTFNDCASKFETSPNPLHLN